MEVDIMEVDIIVKKIPVVVYRDSI